MTDKKTTRCLLCNKEFSDQEIEKAYRCPNCGSGSIPSDIERDVSIKINWHELHILCVFAENWARYIKEKNNITDSSLIVAAIAKRLERQYPNNGKLTLAGEIKDLQKAVEKGEIEGVIGPVSTNIDLTPPDIASEFN
jgi:hypothetical protein